MKEVIISSIVPMLIGKYGKRSHFMAVPIHFKWITWHYFLWLQQSYRNLPVATSGWKTDTSVLMCKQSLFRVALNCVRNPTSCFITFLWSPLTVDLVLTKWGCSDRNNNLFGYLKSFTILVKKKCQYALWMPNIPQSDFQFRLLYHLSSSVSMTYYDFMTKTAQAHG